MTMGRKVAIHQSGLGFPKLSSSITNNSVKERKVIGKQTEKDGRCGWGTVDALRNNFEYC